MISKNYLENGTTNVVYQNETTIGVVDKRYNGSMIPIFINTVSLGVNNKLVLKVNISNLDLFSRLNSIKLSILPNITGYDKPIKLSLETGFSSNTGNYIEDFVVGESNRYEVDITKYVVGEEGKNFYFGISSESSYTVCIDSNDAPYLSINYLEYANSIKNQFLIEGSVGNKINYGVDIRNGALLLSENLYQFTGCLMPMNLNLIYNSVNGGNVVQEGLPQGWKFNYFQKVSFESGTATYLDANGVSHKFIVTNDLNKYHSINGTGMILTKSSDGSSMIFDGMNGYLLFNINGYLTTIRKQIGNSNLDTLLEYNTSNQLVKITDPMGNVVNITYSDSQIQISKDGYPVVNVYRDQNTILRLTESGSWKTEFNYAKPNASVDVYYLYTILNNNGEYTKFKLNKSFKVVEVSDAILKNGKSATVEKRILEYDWEFTKLTNYHNVEKIYTFNEIGEVKSIYKNDNDYIVSLGDGDEEMNKKFIISNSQGKYVLNSKVINDYFGYIGNTKEPLTLLLDNLSFEQDKNYAFSFSYNMQEGNEHREGEYVKFLIEQDQTTLYEIELTPNDNGISISDTFKCISNSTPEFKLWFYTTRSKVQISDVIVTRCNKLERKVCFNIGEEGVTPVECGYGNFYPRTRPFTKIHYTNEAGQTIEKTLKMYEEDMRENIKNNVLANGGRFDLWFNRMKELIPNVKDVVVFADDVFGTDLSNYKMCIYSETDTEKCFVYDEYSDYNPTTNSLKTEYKTIVFENIFYDEYRIVNKDYLIVESESYDGIKYNYLYNTYGNLLKETVSAYDSNLSMEKEYEYSTDGKRLLKEKTLSANLEVAEVEYSYNDKGLLDKVIMPNGLEYNYVYDTDSLKVIKISCSDSNTVTENNISYLIDLVSNVSHKSNIGYDFSYDKYNSISAVKTNYNGTLNDFISMTSEITSNNDEHIIQFPTGYREKVIVDEFGNVIKRLHSTDGITFTTDKEYYYSSHKIQNVEDVNDPESEELNKTESSKLVKTIDEITNDIMRVEYNSDELVKKVTHTNSCYASESIYDYDIHNRMTDIISKDSDTKITTNCQYRDNNYSPTNDIESINVVVTDLNDSYIGNFKHTNYVDQLKRVYREVKRVETIDLDQTYSYGSIDNKTTLIPTSVSYMKSVSGIRDFESFGTINYTYDKMNNIIGVVDGFTTNNISYSYDLFGRLVSEVNNKLDKNYIYSYDDKGNIISKSVTSNGTTTNYNYTYSTTYPDRLTAYNGQTIGYDLNGNITQIGSKILTWTKGKQLETFKPTALSTYTYTYDADGRRISKTGPLNQYSNYTYDGDKLVGEVSYVKLGGTRKLKYIYSGNEILGFILNDVSYLFIKNLQHDIIGIVNTNGEIVAKYVYDAWGNHIVCNPDGSTNTNTSFIGNINPFRYRGYYYDVETGLFMVGHRYYNPEWGRFIQPADVSSLNPSSINGLNLYSYANNNPIGIAYSNSGAGFSISGKMMSSLAISGSIILGYGSSNKGFYWPNLDFLGTGFGYIENSFSMIAGVIDGVRKIKHLDKLAGLDKASNWLMGIGIGINVGLSLYNNLTNSNLSSAQKAGNIVGDIVYIAASSAATWGVSALTAMIPVVGPFLAPVVGFGFGTALDQFWHGEDIFGIDGFSFNPGGKSIDEWIKEFLTELFGG